MTISKEFDPYFWHKEPKYKTSIAYNMAKDLLIFIKRCFTTLGIITALVVGCIYTNHDAWICNIDGQFSDGIFIIHDYILNTYGPK